MPAYLYSAPAGVPGEVNRAQDSIVEPIILGEAFDAFGVPYKLDPTTGKAMMIDTSDTAAVFAGIISRSVPSISGNLTSGYDDAIPNQDAPNGGCVFGYISVKCPVGTPVKGQGVYMRVTAGVGEVLGSLETGADGGDCVLLSGVEWSVNGKDANNNTEIRIF